MRYSDGLESSRRSPDFFGSQQISGLCSSERRRTTAFVGRLTGYRVRIIMPEGMSEERKKLIQAPGRT
jgi:hypothetical protein